MPSTLCDYPDTNKPPHLERKTIIKPVLIFDCYVDTVVSFLPVNWIERADFNRLLDLYDGENPMKRNKERGTSSVVVQCPQPEMLNELAQLEEKYGGNITRLDVSADARPDPNMSPELQLAFIKSRMLMLRRPTGPIDDNYEDGGALYCRQTDVANKQRDIGVYCDRTSKLRPNGPRVAHIDLRLLRRALRTSLRSRQLGRERLGVIERTNEILTLDPSDLYARHVRFVEFDIEHARRDLFREIAENAGTIEEARRLIQHEERLGQLDYVQRWHDRKPTLRLQTAPGLVQMPDRLTDGAVRRRKMEKRID